MKLCCILWSRSNCVKNIFLFEAPSHQFRSQSFPICLIKYIDNIAERLDSFDLSEFRCSRCGGVATDGGVTAISWMEWPDCICTRTHTYTARANRIIPHNVRIHIYKILNLSTIIFHQQIEFGQTICENFRFNLLLSACKHMQLDYNNKFNVEIENALKCD